MKKVIGLVVGLACLMLGWYVFIRAFEFEVNFKAKTLPGDIIQTIRIWNKTLPDASIVTVDSLDNLVQKIQWKGRSYVYTWNFDIIDDSTTHVSVFVSEPDKAIANKLLIPFTNQPVEQDAAEIVQIFHDLLQVHLRITRVVAIGETETLSSFCVCRSLTTLQTEKAYGMMKDYDILTSFVSSFNLKANGPPIVKVTRWSHTSNQLSFDFCFPIVKPDTLPPSNAVVFKVLGGEKALKAEYYGNYITSDRAWYELTRAAQNGGYKIAGLPIEYFHHNPNLGLNERQWKAEVFLPIE